MQPMIRRRTKAPMSGIMPPLLILLALFLCQPASAQETQRPIITLQGLIHPERETVTLRAECNGRTFTFTIRNRRIGASALLDARLGRRPSRNPGALANLRQFLSTVRNVYFGSSACVSENEIEIGLSALLLSPPPQQRDDVIRIFRVHF